MLKKFMKKEDGFTLVELITVIAVIAILAAVMVPKFSNFKEGAQKSNAMSTAKNVQLAIEAYNAENGSYPSVAELRTYDVNIKGSDALKISSIDADGNFAIGLLGTNGKWYDVSYNAGDFKKPESGTDTSTVTDGGAKAEGEGSGTEGE